MNRFYIAAVVLLLAAICMSAASATAVAQTDETPVATQQETQPDELQVRIDRFFGDWLVKPLSKVLFFDFWTEQWLGTSVPAVIIWLSFGAVFFTIRMGFMALPFLGAKR